MDSIWQFAWNLKITHLKSPKMNVYGMKLHGKHSKSVKNHGVFSQNVLIFANCQIGFSEFLTMLSVKLGLDKCNELWISGVIFTAGEVAGGCEGEGEGAGGVVWRWMGCPYYLSVHWTGCNKINYFLDCLFLNNK